MYRLQPEVSVKLIIVTGLSFNYIKSRGSVDYYVHILYVAPSSPAAEAGLKRGDWIHKIDAKAIDNSNYTTHWEAMQ